MKSWVGLCLKTVLSTKLWGLMEASVRSIESSALSAQNGDDAWRASNECDMYLSDPGMPFIRWNRALAASRLSILVAGCSTVDCVNPVFMPIKLKSISNANK